MVCFVLEVGDVVLLFVDIGEFDDWDVLVLGIGVGVFIGIVGLLSRGFCGVDCLYGYVYCSVFMMFLVLLMGLCCCYI